MTRFNFHSDFENNYIMVLNCCASVGSREQRRRNAEIDKMILAESKKRANLQKNMAKILLLGKF